MPAKVVVGVQWGDEGKGKIIDILASRAEVVVRSQGGNNAGHTVESNGQVYKLQLIPSSSIPKGFSARSTGWSPAGFPAICSGSTRAPMSLCRGTWCWTA